MAAKTIIKVAIADDHVLFRKGIVELLADFKDINVLFDAGNGEELLQKIQASDIKPDVCLLDIKMPVMDGFETAKHIKKHWPEMKMLAVSMFNQEHTIIKMLRCGVNGYVLKDIEPHELRKAIMEANKK